MRGGHGQRIFPKATFGATEIARQRVVTVNRGEGRVLVVYLPRVFILLWLGCGRGSEDREVAFVHYVELTAP